VLFDDLVAVVRLEDQTLYDSALAGSSLSSLALLVHTERRGRLGKVILYVLVRSPETRLARRLSSLVSSPTRLAIHVLCTQNIHLVDIGTHYLAF
jgi:hypothetical protein